MQHFYIIIYVFLFLDLYIDIEKLTIRDLTDYLWVVLDYHQKCIKTDIATHMGQNMG